MTTFLSIGECMVEMSPDGAGKYRLGFAGDTFNTAWYLAQLAPETTKVAYMTGAGNDALSQRFIAFMKQAGITPHVQIVPDRSLGLYLIELSNGERSFQYWRSVSAARLLTHELSALQALQAGDIAYFSGITMAILAPEHRSDLLDALALARSTGVTVAFDPNLRLRLWRDAEEMRDWILRAAQVANVAMPSFEDDATAFGDATPLDTLARYRAAGAGTIVVKDGPGPVTARHDGGKMISVSPPEGVVPVDTTAAGDSFNAGFFNAMLRGAPLEAAIRAGCALSVRVISHPGALVPVVGDTPAAKVIQP